MRKSIETLIKGLFMTALMSVAAVSCQDDKPEIEIPPTPQPPQEQTEYALTMLSGDIIPYEEDSVATVRFRTKPWDLLSKEDTEFKVTDMSGKQDSDLFSIYGKSFMPDSSWCVQLNLKDSIDEDISLRFTVSNPDTVMSAQVTFSKIELKMLSVMTAGNREMTYDSKTLTYSYTYNGLTDLSAQKFKFRFVGDRISLGDSTFNADDYCVMDARKPFIVSIWSGSVHKDYTISYRMTDTGLPVVCINTYGRNIPNRKDWVGDCTMYIMYPDGEIDYEDTLSIKGRGNQTWSDFNKKPYALKLNKKAKILGMHKNKRWILLANVKDRTLLRNDVSFWISKQTNIPYTVNGQFVELVWNGVHKGNYYLCEQPRIDKNRIEIHKPDLNDPEKGGYFMNIDALFEYNDAKWADKGDDLGFWSKTYNMPYIFKDPDEDEDGNLLTKSSPSYTYFYDYIGQMETALNSIRNSSGDKQHEWMKYLDMETAVDFALIQEITMNHDAYNSWPKNGPHSTYVYKDSCGLLCFGPVWDFDYHTYTLYGDFEYGNTTWNSNQNPRIQQWEIMKMTNKSGGKYYFSDLKKDPLFKELLVERWDTYKVAWKDGFDSYVDEMADKIRKSESINQQIWGYPSRQNGDWNLTFDEAVKAMKTTFSLRLQWIDNNINNL